MSGVFATLLLLAVLAESVVEIIKDITHLQDQGAKVASLLVGLVLAVGAGQDLFGLIGVPFAIPYVGMILSGLLISRGANYLHDFTDKLGGRT